MRKTLLFFATFLPIISFASVVPDGFAIDTADIVSVAGVLLTAFGTIWVARRVIGFLAR
jgi:hypothetical protein